MKNKKYYIFASSLILGIIVVMQINSIMNIENDSYRDSQSNIFQEISILKSKNEDLKKEILKLESTLSELSDQNLALKSIEEEIIAYQKLSGKYPIFGSGIKISIDGEITAPWTIDLINELFNSKAEAVSINNIRISNSVLGIDTMPNGEMLLNGSILSSPYIFYAIGEASEIKEFLDINGGILDRILANNPNVIIRMEEMDIIKMD